MFDRRHRFPRLFVLLFLAGVVASVSAYADTPRPSFRSASSAATSSDATSVSIPRPSGAQQGDVMVAAVTIRLGEEAWIDRPDGWVPVRRDSCDGPQGTLLTQALFHKVVSSSEPSSYRWSFAAPSGAVGQIAAYSNAATSNAVTDSSGRQTRNSVAFIAPSVTTDVPGSLVVAAFGTSGANVIDPPSGMTRREFQITGLGATTTALATADRVQDAAGASGDLRTRTLTSNLCNLSQAVALRPASASSPSTPSEVPPPAAPVAPSSTQVPAVSGTARVSSQLTSSQGVWTGTVPMSYGYQWQRCPATSLSCANVWGATTAAYTPTNADVGYRMRSVVRATNVAGTAVATSSPTTAVTAATLPTSPPPPSPTAPSNVTPPAVSGNAVAGQSLSATTGTWSGTEPMTTARQWLRCNTSGGSCAPISATGDSYTLASGDVGATIRVAVTATNSAGSASAQSAPTAVVAPAASTPPPPPPPSSGGTVVVNGRSWVCDGPVNLDLVKVSSPSGDAIVLASGCTGRIGRIEVDTWTQDGVKVQNQSDSAHDVQIGGGYVRCHAIAAGAHQDAMQAMGGTRISFRNVSFDCLGNSNFFVARGGSGASTPTEIMCDGCSFGRNSGQSVFIATSVRSGVRSSTVCHGRFDAFRVEGATSPVIEGNTELAHNDPRCVQGF